MRLLLAAIMLLITSNSWAESLKLVSTIKPVHLLVSTIAGDLAHNDLIIPSNQSPHHYSLRTSTKSKLAHADIVFWSGQHIESGLAQHLNNMPNAFPLIEAVHLDGSDHSYLDPHKALAMATRIESILSAKDPSNAQIYKDNLSKFSRDIEALDRDIRGTLRGLEQRLVLLHHDSTQAFEQRYGLRRAGVLLPGHGGHSSVRNTAEIAQKLADGSVDCALLEPQMPRKLFDALKVSEHTLVVEIDPINGRVGGDPVTYVQLIRDFAHSLSQCGSRAESARHSISSGNTV